VVLCRVDFEQNLVWELRISGGSRHSSQHNFCGNWQPQGHKTKRNQPLSFFHMHPTNTIVCTSTRKSFIGSVVLCRVDFEQNLGWKSVIDPPA
jgi:hypothetical protein